MGDGDAVGGDRRLLLVALHLAGDRLLDRLHDIAPLEDAVLLQRLRRQLLTLRVLGLEVQVDAVDHRGGTAGDGLGDVGLAELLTVDGGREGAKAVELHRLALGDELLHTVDHLLDHQLAHLLGGDLAVLGHVTAEALQVDGFLPLDLGEILAEGGTLVIGVLAKINHHGNV